MHPAHEHATCSRAASSSAAAPPASAPPPSPRCCATIQTRPDAQRRGGLPGLPHFAPKAKRVIYLFQNGAPDARRSVRLQAGADAACTASQMPESRRRGQALQHDDRRPDRASRACRPIEPSSRSTARAAPGSATSCRTRPAIADDLCFIKIDAHRRGEPRPGDHASS